MPDTDKSSEFELLLKMLEGVESRLTSKLDKIEEKFDQYVTQAVFAQYKETADKAMDDLKKSVEGLKSNRIPTWLTGIIGGLIVGIVIQIFVHFMPATQTQPVLQTTTQVQSQQGHH